VPVKTSKYQIENILNAVLSKTGFITFARFLKNKTLVFPENITKAF
jgi:hypothetical protein